MSSRNKEVRAAKRSESGQTLILTAAMLPLLIGVTGLAVDVGMLYHHKRRMQTAVDAAAMAGGGEMMRNRFSQIVSSGRAGSTTNGFTHGGSTTVNVYHPPITGFYVGNVRFVEAQITQPSPTYFMQIFGWDEVNIVARAVAGAGANGEYCFYVLDPSMDDAFHAGSNADLNANCGVMVNSNSSRAMRTSSNSSVTASHVSVTGNYRMDGGLITPTPDIDVPAAPDPLAYLQPPSVGACDHTNFHVNSGTVTASPGVYCKGIKVNAGARVILDPGMYVLLGGGLELQSGAKLEGNGVTFFITAGTGNPYGTVSFQSGSQVELKAPTTGPYSGILFYQDPNAGSPNNTHHMESHTNSYMEGALYFPTQVVRLHSQTSLEARYTLVVARSVDMMSSANFQVRSDYGGLAGGSPIKKLSLVE
jgi:hypothetical protein